MLRDVDNLYCIPRAFYEQLVDAYAPLVGSEELEKMAPALEQAAEALTEYELKASDLERLGIKRRHRAALLLALLVKKNPRLLSLSDLESNLGNVVQRLANGRGRGQGSQALRTFFDELHPVGDESSSPLGDGMIRAVTFLHGEKRFPVTGERPPEPRPLRHHSVPGPTRVEVLASLEKSSKGWSVVTDGSRKNLDALTPKQLSRLRKMLSSRVHDLESRGDHKAKDSLLGALMNASSKLALEETMTKELLDAVTTTLQRKIDGELMRLGSLERTLRDKLGSDNVGRISSEQMEALVAGFGITSPRRSEGASTNETGGDRTEAFLGAIEAAKEQAIKQGYSDLTYSAAGLEAGRETERSEGIGPGDIFDLFVKTGSGEQKRIGTVLSGQKTKETLTEEIAGLLPTTPDPVGRLGQPNPRMSERRIGLEQDRR